MPSFAVAGPTIFTNVFGNYAFVSGLMVTNSRSAVVNLGTLTLSNCAMVNGFTGGPGVPPFVRGWNLQCRNTRGQ